MTLFTEGEIDISEKDLYGEEDPWQAVDADGFWDECDEYGEAQLHGFTVKDAPTNGLEDVIDWDWIEAGLAVGMFDSKQEVGRVVAEMFEGSDIPFVRGYYRQMAKGLFPEYRELYNALPPKTLARSEVAA